MYENKLRSSCTSVKFQKLWGKKNSTNFQRETEKKRVEGVYKREGGRERERKRVEEGGERERERKRDRQKEGEYFFTKYQESKGQILSSNTRR